ncbi:MAG TPA: hypothetical protein VHS59_14335 [Bacillota bacterium]|nr:hypothetical protein [Bacillota bacterium]
MEWYLALLISWLGFEVISLVRRKRVINPGIRENLAANTRQAKVFLRTGIIIGLFAPVAGINFHMYFYLLAGVNLALGLGLYLMSFRQQPGTIR